MTPIDVVVVTWPNHPRRMEYFIRTLAALRRHLTASRHHLVWHCSAESERDPTTEWYGDQLDDACRCYFSGPVIQLHWRNPPASLGGAMNSAYALGDAPVTFLVQDDWELLYPLDLSPGVELLQARPEIDLLRYSYYLHPVNGTQFDGGLESTSPQFRFGFRRVRIDGPWPYGDDPQMRRRDWLHGPYLEGPPHGMSEGDMVHRLVRNRAVIFAADRCYFGTFGEVSAVPVSQEVRPRAVSR